LHIGNPQGDIEEAMNPQGDPYRKKELDGLMHFRKLMLIYRLVHYKDIITEIHIGIKRRNKELCKSYIQLFYGSNVQQEIEDTLQKFLYSKNNRIYKSRIGTASNRNGSHIIWEFNNINISNTIFSLDKLENVHRSYKAEIKIKTILNHILEAKAIAQLKYLIIMM
jgi:hypothetical protein